MRKKVSFFLASMFGAGYFPFAPGTIGSLVTLPFVWLVTHYFGPMGLFSVIVVMFVVGIVATREVLKHTKHDPSFVVIDEFVGQALAFVFVADYVHVWWVWVLGFVLFRFFDIVKIGPVKYFDEKVSNEWGVMMDDVVAGIFAAVILTFVLHIAA